MLILTRKKGERIIIEYPNADVVVIEFQKVKSSGSVIGTDAPKHIEVLRSELVKPCDDSQNAKITLPAKKVNKAEWLRLFINQALRNIFRRK